MVEGAGTGGTDAGKAGGHRRPGTNALLAAACLALAIGMALLTVQLHRPLPDRITDWGDLGGLPSWLGALLPATRWSARATLALTIAALVGANLAAVRALRAAEPRRGSLLLVAIGAATLSSIPVLAPHRLSGDVYAYIMYGRVSAVHGANPMTTPPASFPDDPFLAWMSPGYHDTPSVYGPAWNGLSHVLTLVAEALGGEVRLYLLLYHVACLAGFLLSIWAVWELLGRWRPRRQVAGTVLYAWSPLALLEAGAIHNDFVMLGLVGVAIVVADRGRHVPAVALLTLAVLVKWIAVVVLIAVVLGAVGRAGSPRAGWLLLARDTGVALLVAATCLLPFGDPVSSLLSPFNAEVSGAINSLAELVTIALPRAAAAAGIHLSIAQAMMAAEAVAKIMVLGVLALVTAKALKAPSLRSSVSIAASGLLAITLVAPKLWPWYALWSLMLAPMAARATRAGAVTLSVMVLLIYALSAAEDGRTVWTAGLPVWIVAPVLAAVGWEWRREQASRRFTPATGAEQDRGTAR